MYLEVSADGSTNSLDRFTYDNYLCVARNRWSPDGTSATDRFVWDPTEPVATRPLVWNFSTFQPFTLSTCYYAIDANKNVSELVSSADGSISAHYEYAPFGEVILSSGDLAMTNPFRFSSEYADDTLVLVYYNYRHLEPVTGRWLSRDPIEENGVVNIFSFVANNILLRNDSVGLNTVGDFFEALWAVMEHLAAGATIGISVRNWFLDNMSQYQCCPKGVQEPVGLDRYDGVINGTKASWTIAHRITGCQLKAIGLSEEEVILLNGFHETYEFFRPWNPEMLAFMDKFSDFKSLVDQIGLSVWQYLNDTISDIEAVMEGFNSDGANCYEKYIPSECKLKTSK